MRVFVIAALLVVPVLAFAQQPMMGPGMMGGGAMGPGMMGGGAMGPGMMGGGMMGPGMMGGGMMGGGGGLQNVTDMNPVWAANGQNIAFTRAQGQSVAGGAVSAAGGDPTELVNMLEPMAWATDCSFVICGIKTRAYSGFWRMSLENPTDARLIARAKNPLLAAVSPDKSKVLLVDERADDNHDLLVGVGNAAPKSVYLARDSEKLLQAGWTNDSNHIWLLLELVTDEELKPGDSLPEKALAPQQGPGMGAATATVRALFRMKADGTEKVRMAEDANDILAVAWSPVEERIAVVRGQSTSGPGTPAGGGMMMGPGMMGPGGGGMMGPGMMGGGGMMGPGMMGGGGMMGPGMMGGGGMMGPGMMGNAGTGAAAPKPTYLALRSPANNADETVIADPSVPIRQPIWSPDGKMIAGVSPAQGRVFVVSIADGVLTEVAQNFDLDVHSLTSLAWSPDSKRLVYSGVSDEISDNMKVISRGLFVRSVAGGDASLLTVNQTQVPLGGGGMMGPGGGMMGPGMMGGGGMMGPGMMGGGGMMGPGMMGGGGMMGPGMMGGNN